MFANKSQILPWLFLVQLSVRVISSSIVLAVPVVYQLLERSYTWQREKIQYHWFCYNRHFLAFIFYDTFDLILGFVNAPAFSL